MSEEPTSLLVVDVRPSERAGRLLAELRFGDGRRFVGSASHLFAKGCEGVTARELAIADAFLQAMAGGAVSPGPPTAVLPEHAAEKTETNGPR